MGLKYYFQWVGRDRVRLGCRIGDTTYSQEFERDTPLGDALDVVRQMTVRKATGLPPDADNENEPE